MESGQTDTMIVEKRVFSMPELTTLSGKTIKNVRVGWECYGTLNADKSNAILINHYFSGTSHAAGKYSESDPLPGYWDAIIGPGKAIDTNKYFVFSSDTLVNLNARDKNVVTTGPASIDPATGKPYGLSFPIVTIADFVNVEKALVESLGITKLHAIAGPSMGGLQTFQWAWAYPEMVERIMPVISAGDASPWLIAWLNVWATPVRMDPAWKNGNYYESGQPLTGLVESLKVVSLHANHWKWAEKTFGVSWAEAGKDPLAAHENRFKVETALEGDARMRAAVADANHFLYLIKANQNFASQGGIGIEGLKKIKAKVLLLHSPGDQVFPGEWTRTSALKLKEQGLEVEIAEIEGDFGHLDGVFSIAPHAERIRAFLSR